MIRIKDEVEKTISDKVINFSFNDIITANNINSILNHYDNKMNVILKCLSKVLEDKI